jgi:subtilisin family serine protease
MRPGKFALLFLLAVALPAQVVPDRFVLELAEAPVGRTRGARRVVASQASVRAAMRTRLGARAEVKDFTEVVMNSLIVRSSASESELAALPGVRRVWPVYEIHPELDRVVGLLGVTKAWEAVGGSDRAGAGMKIGILDTGLDLRHPAFRGETMMAPQGFPMATNEDIRSQLNGKVIVYRTYDRLGTFEESSLDYDGHGTAVAMIAAGLRATSPRGEIQGVAPAAWLGIYKVFLGPNASPPDSATVMKAMDDAVADGMDVLNMSLGFPLQLLPTSDPLASSLARAASLGVLVVKSNGNSGPQRASGTGPLMGAAGIMVGGSWTDRIFLAGIRVNGGAAIEGLPGNGPAPSGPIVAPFRDVANFDPSGWACTPLPAGVLAGSVALILRGGGCTFETKVNIAEAAGATAVVIYTTEASPEAFYMDVGVTRIPALMVSYQDGVAVKGILANRESQVEFAVDDSLPFLGASNGILDYSSRGPGTDGRIVPDILAVGEEVLSATQKNNPTGTMYDPSGYIVRDGTSFAAPAVAGAYATLKAGRPGLTVSQYRSLLVNTAQPIFLNQTRQIPVQEGGAGRMDLMAALRGRLTMNPVSVSFGLGGQRADLRQTIRVVNTTENLGSWKVEVDSTDAMKATVNPSEFSLGPNDTVDLSISLSGDVPVGETQGFLLFRAVDAPDGERPQRLAYWYGVPSGKPASAMVLPLGEPPVAGSTISMVVVVADAIGATLGFDAPLVTPIEGAGSFIDANPVADTFPGAWLVRVRLGATAGQTNRFRIQAGTVVREVSIISR